MESSKKNFVYNSAYQILAIIIPLITTPYLTRVLGAQGLGDYSYAFSIAYYFVIVMKLGLDNYGNRTIASVRDDKKQLSETFWGIYITQITLSLAVIVVYLVYCFEFSNNKIISYALILYIFSGALDINWFFWGLEEFKLTVTRNTIIKLLTTMLIFILVKHQDDVVVYTIIMALGYLLSQLLIWPFVFKHVYFVHLNKDQIIIHIKPNLVLFIPVIAISLYKMMDKIMLGIMTNTTEVGYYDASEQVIKIPMALINSLGTVMLPRMSNLRANAKESEARSAFDKSIDLAMFLATSLGFGIMGIAKTFVPWYYGKGFAVCIQLFLILLPSCMFLAFANVVRTQYLIPFKRDKVYVSSVIVGAIVNITLNSLLIPYFKSIGAAIGTLFAEMSVCILQVLLVRKEINIDKSIKASIKYVIAGMIMFFTIYLMNFKSLPIILNLLIQILLGSIVYITIIVIIVSLNKVVKKV